MDPRVKPWVKPGGDDCGWGEIRTKSTGLGVVGQTVVCKTRNSDDYAMARRLTSGRNQVNNPMHGRNAQMWNTVSMLVRSATLPNSAALSAPSPKVSP